MTDEQFTKAVRAFGKVLTVETMAGVGGVSLPTVERWKSGHNLPYAALRSRIVQAWRRTSFIGFATAEDGTPFDWSQFETR